MDLATLIKKMITLESYVGEEYVTSAHLILARMAAEEVGLQLGIIKD